MRSRIIAELSSAHNGSLEMLKALVRAAAESGCDVVKTQAWQAKHVSDTDPDKARYTALEFRDEWWPEFMACCKEYGVEPLTSCFNADRVEFLAGLGMKRVKLASVCLTNTDLLMMAGRHFDEVILSTGMATKEEIENAADVLSSNAKDFTLLHCVAEYPLPLENANLDKMWELKRLLTGQEYAHIGFSSHSLDLDVPKTAIAMRAKYVEAHLTLSRLLPQQKHSMYKGAKPITVHEIALEPDEMRALADYRDKVAKMTGTGEFKVSDTEEKIRRQYVGRYGK